MVSLNGIHTIFSRSQLFWDLLPSAGLSTDRSFSEVDLDLQMTSFNCSPDMMPDCTSYISKHWLVTTTAVKINYQWWMCVYLKSSVYYDVWSKCVYVHFHRCTYTNQQQVNICTTSCSDAWWQLAMPRAPEVALLGLLQWMGNKQLMVNWFIAEYEYW